MSLFFFSYRRGQGSSFYNIDRWEESCISSLFFLPLRAELVLQYHHSLVDSFPTLK